ncbi:tRNA pseudouridine(38-40) synthase TruA [Mesonia aestuariivivens]|uniref:tRNA pseudouridine synthase A n=1 Tax=Mesonia aestuariivivens TaxID=2796128 RepID=A0ABS6VZM9_9FLAO|nr:tRNA pseudouridine(38-40) synthase TruA [Mesonia aestuariivivens]MBW2961060.1 tRNA pseudouridine(38-40) synthase TruA [Mesonia aestuariivivens]
MRYFLDLAYDGSAFHGWQIQPNAISVQETLEKALAVAFQKKIGVVGAGRTDTGVHAKQLIAHLDLEKQIDERQLQFKLNTLLPDEVGVNSIYRVKEDAHARFTAIAREYKYYISTTKDPFSNSYSYYIKKELDLQRMNEAAKILLNYKDFKCFSKSKTDVFTYNCAISFANWEQKDNLLVFTIKADRFLRNMVRAIVGTLVEIGLHKLKVEDLYTIIESRNRSKAGKSVDAKGLFLTKVEYPNSILI